MIIERYSDEGFEPQTQHKLINDVEYYSNSWEENLKEYWPDADPDSNYMKRVEYRYREVRDYYIDNAEYLKKGVWAFPFGKMDKFYLNHLKRIPRRNIAYINDSEMALLPPSQLINRISYFEGYPEIYIPEVSLRSLEVLEEDTSQNLL